jgi:uncharacterized protein YcgL (UPF0745 family)
MALKYWCKTVDKRADKNIQYLCPQALLACGKKKRHCLLVHNKEMPSRMPGEKLAGMSAPVLVVEATESEREDIVRL